MQLIHGDCLEVMKDIPDKSVDMILADPPYGTTACKWDVVIPFALMWEQLKRIIKQQRAIVLTASQPFTSALVMSNPHMFKHEWIWKKNAGSNFGAVKFQPMKEHESVLVFCSTRPLYFPQMQSRSEAGQVMIRSGVKSKPSKGGDVYAALNQGYDNSKCDPFYRYPSSVQTFKRERGLHPTQKPVDLLAYLIRTYTLEGETVFDFTMGSGSTGVACVNTGRDFIGIEKDEKYYGIAVKRINEAVLNKKEVFAFEGAAQCSNN